MATTQTVLNSDGGEEILHRRPLAPQSSGGASELDISQFGTFADSKGAPIHRWFQYPAGFSFRAVEYALDTFGIRPGQRVYDPFTGTGTTEVTCKGRGVSSGGTEAHPFVVRIAQTKVRWDYD
ncbi:DNA modification methyltransferase, partial [mine drainage metagenome]